MSECMKECLNELINVAIYPKYSRSSDHMLLGEYFDAGSRARSTRVDAGV